MSLAGPWIRLLSLLAALGLVMLCLVSPPPAQAAAAEATVRLESVTPGVAEPGGPVTLSGTVTNTGTVPLYTVQVMTCRDSTRISDRDQLGEVLAADPATAPCQRITTEGSFTNITPSGEAFQPGATASFSVTTTTTDLGLGSTGGYLVGVHVRASTDRSASYQTVGRARTLLPLYDASRLPGTTPVSTVVLLASRPALVRPGVLADDHLATELTGRLLTLVQAAQRSGAAYAIDPALHREATTMAAGYRLADGSPGTGQAAAQIWLTEYAKLAGQTGYRLPYGNPDLALATRQGDASIPQRSAHALAEVPDLARLPLLVRAGNGRADQPFLHYVSGMAPAVVLAETRDTGPARLGSGVLVAGTDPDALAGGPGPDRRDTDLQRIQRQRLASLLAALAGAPTVRVVDDEPAARADAASDAPWEVRQPLSTLTTQRAWTPSLSTGAAGGPLSDQVSEPLARAVTGYALYGDLLGSADIGAQLAARSLAAVPSASWADDQQALRFLELSSAEVSELGSGISLRVSPRVTMTSRENQFPVTVTNHLPAQVTVKVQFESSNPARLQVPDSTLVRVGSGESVTVSVNPAARVTGEVDMVARLATESGVRVGAPEKFVIEATEAGKVGWVIVITSGVVLVAMTVWRVRQVTRSRSGGESA